MIRNAKYYFTLFYQSIVSKVDAHLKYAADTGCHGDQEVDLTGFAERNVFLLLRPNEPVQEVMPGIDLTH